MSEQYDIVIVGGGMIGTSLALALAPLNLRIAVVEAVERRALAQPSFDDRTTALSRSSQRMFEAMDLWDEIVAAATPIRDIHVSDKGRFGFSHINAAEQHVEALGYVVINRVLGQVLQSRLDALTDVDVFCPAHVSNIDLNAERAIVSIEGVSGTRATATKMTGTRTIQSKLLIACDGANSTVRSMMGIAAQTHHYGQRAVVGNLQAQKALNHVAYERFTPQGPLAILPLNEQRASFIWTVAEEDADRVLSLDDDTFLAELQAEFGYRLGCFSKIGKRAAYPLVLSKAIRLTAVRSVLVGNSAHGLHPVSAQGFNLGLRDVASICDCIADAQGSNTSLDVGGADLLRRYAEWRRNDQKKLVQFTDNLVRLFGSSRFGVGTLRNLGMLGFDLVPGVRGLFAKHTMGLAGELPRLSRGVPVSNGAAR